MSQVPALPGLVPLVDATFASGGALARAMPGFEPRAGQREMARAVAAVLADGGVLLAEAGTGTGKTVAYLVPSILSRQRVLISTGTKNLQEQIFFKDIPALQEALGTSFTATYMKGRANYLCLHKLDGLCEDTQTHHVLLPIIRAWAARTETGDRAELEDLPEDLPFWTEVSATAETCLGSECPRYHDCFVTRMRQRAAESDLVIVNHHLLCADAALRHGAGGEVIPSCGNVVLDEAHQLEEVATQYFGVSVSTYRLEELARDAAQLIAMGRLSDPTQQREVEEAVQRIRDRSRGFFTELAETHRGIGRQAHAWQRSSPIIKDERIRATAETMTGLSDATAHLTGALDILESSLADIVQGAPGAQKDSSRDDGLPLDDLQALSRRAATIRDEVRFLVRAGDPDFVYFVERRLRGIFLRACPIDVSGVIRETLLDRMRTVVMTSATLTVDGRFDYVRARLGIPEAQEVRLSSEFDYGQQALLYLPRRMPDPRTDGFATAAGKEVIEILKRTQGRAFVLFTSYTTMRTVQAMAEMALDYPILAQGVAPRSQLIRQFRETPHAVLFATSSFWQGVDVVGEALSCVIIDKLPFASPADPVTAARIDAIRARGGDPFGEYQVPLAILTLQQGLGRLIRHRQDRGVLAVLDPRLRTKGYGRRFVESLPPAPVVHDLSHVEAFFSS